MKHPIVYSNHYNIKLMGLEKAHPFDTGKYGKVWDFIQKQFKLGQEDIYTPKPVSRGDLLTIHTERYLQSLETDRNEISSVIGLPLPSIIPISMINRMLLEPVKYAVQGTVMAAQLAWKHGWAINLSGGYHHAHPDRGSGFSFFNDHILAAKTLMKKKPGIKILYVDLDAHMGDGVLAMASSMENFYILDLYNTFEEQEEDFIEKTNKNRRIVTLGLKPYTSDDVYLELLYRYLPERIEEIKPDIIFYNAGSDVLQGDTLGCLDISTDAIVKRDAFVFLEALRHGTPIMMALSGGYGKDNHKVVSQSVFNLLYHQFNYK